MSQTVRQRLEDLRDETEADSLTEIIRRSLGVYKFVWKEKAKGRTGRDPHRGAREGTASRVDDPLGESFTIMALLFFEKEVYFLRM